MIRMTDNVLKFAQTHNANELFDAFKDFYNHNRALQGAKDVEYDRTKSFDEKNALVNASLKETISKIAGVTNFDVLPAEAWASHPTYKWATFAVVGALIDMVIPDTIIDSIGAYTDVRTIGFGDNAAFDIEPNDLFYVSKVGKGKKHAEAQKSFNGQVVVTPVEHDVAVQVDLYRVLAGKENLASFAMKCVRSMETEMAYEAYTSFNTAMGAVPSTAGKELQYSGFTQDNFIALTNKVSAYNNGMKPMVIGTRTAISKILPSDTNYRLQIDSEYVKIGYVREFFGVDVMVLPQKANWKEPYQTLLDDKKIYCMAYGAQKPIKLVIEGSTLNITDDVYTNADLTQRSTFKKMWGTGVASNSSYGFIQLP